MTTRWLVVLLNGDRPWESRKALRVVWAETPEQAVREAHRRPPSRTQVTHALVWPVTGEAAQVEVKVAAPEWGAVRQAPISEKVVLP